ncbi:unnamed protein product, partial [Allacma fusca]
GVKDLTGIVIKKTSTNNQSTLKASKI